MIGGLNLHTTVESMRMMMIDGTMSLLRTYTFLQTLVLQVMMESMMRTPVRPSKLHEWPNP